MAKTWAAWHREGGLSPGVVLAATGSRPAGRGDRSALSSSLAGAPQSAGVRSILARSLSVNQKAMVTEVSVVERQDEPKRNGRTPVRGPRSGMWCRNRDTLDVIGNLARSSK
jgi:hypothetical protein